jgi:uncharacterized protein involved in exopolysaccharide biosynthesis
MNDSNFSIIGDEPVEARIVAWVLGEASGFEAGELERLCAERPELLVFRRRMRALHGLLTEAEAAQPDDGWKLPPEKRKALDEVVGCPEPVRIEPVLEKRVRHAARRALLSIAACVLLTFVVLFFIPSDSYESEAVIEVKPRSVGVSMFGVQDASAAPAKQLNPQFFATEVEMIKSRRNLEQVADNLSLEKRWGVDRETAIRKLKDSIRTENVKGTDLMSIRARANDPEDAKQIASEVTKSYKHYRNQIEAKEEERALAELNKAVRDQENKVEERRKLLATIANTKGIIYKGQDSFYNQGGIDEDQGARQALQEYEKLESEKLQLKTQVESLQKYDADQLAVYAAGLDLPDNGVRAVLPKYQEEQRKIESLKVQGLAENHPTLKDAEKNLAEAKSQLEEGVTNLRATLAAKLELADNRLKEVEKRKGQTREEAIKRGLDAQDYADAKRDFEADQELLQNLKLKKVAADIGSRVPFQSVEVHDDPIQGEPERKSVASNLLGKVSSLGSVLGTRGESKAAADMAASTPAARGRIVDRREGKKEAPTEERLLAQNAPSGKVALKTQLPPELIEGTPKPINVPNLDAPVNGPAGAGSWANNGKELAQREILRRADTAPATPAAPPSESSKPVAAAEPATMPQIADADTKQDSPTKAGAGTANFTGSNNRATVVSGAQMDIGSEAAMAPMSPDQKPSDPGKGWEIRDESQKALLSNLAPDEAESDAPTFARGPRPRIVPPARRMFSEGAASNIHLDQPDDAMDGAVPNVGELPEIGSLFKGNGSNAASVSGNRSGDHPVSRNSIDAILSNPDQNPDNAAANAERSNLEDPIRTSPALTDEHNGRADEVRRNLHMAEGNMNLGKFDEAKKGYYDTLRIDPNNAAARKGMEQLAAAKSAYYRAAYDHTRAELLSEADNAWEDSVPADQKNEKAGIKVVREFNYPTDYEPAAPPSDITLDGATIPLTPAIPDAFVVPSAPAKPDLAKLMEEISASNDPYSTFSLNISDASFKIAQAALAKGERPDPAGVKVEQFYNAVDYGDPAPSGAEPVALAAEQCAHPVIPGRELVRVAVKTAAAGRSAAQPLRLTLLVDQSGSMVRADRRDAMAEALSGLAGLLTANDKVTLIGFSRAPHLLADGMSGSEAGKLPGMVHQEAAEGGTNLEEAIKLAAQLAARHKLAGAQNRIVLFTDGAANLGDADPARLAGRVKNLRQAGFAFDVAGIAADDLNDELLGELARNGNGRYYIVGKGGEGGFAQRLAGAFRPAAENVKVQVRFNPERVARYKLIGFEKDRLKTEDFRNDAVDAAEMAAEEAGVAIYQVETIPGGSGELGEVSVRFRDAARDTMVERTMALPHAASTPAIDKASPSMQLAVLSMLAAEKLRGGPLGDAVDFSNLNGPRGNVRAFFGPGSRAAEMLQVIDSIK